MSEIPEHSVGPVSKSNLGGCLAIVQDMPGERLTLVWRGLPPHFLARNLLSLFLYGFAIVFLTIAAMITHTKLPPGWMFRFDLLWQFAVVLAIFGGSAVFVTRQWLRMISSHFGYWQSFDWDASTGNFQACYRGHALSGARTVTIPLTSIRGLSVAVAAAKSGRLPIDLQFHLQGPSAGNGIDPIRLVVDQLDQRSEAMDLVFRISRVIGLQSYTIQESTLRTLKLKVLRDVSDRSSSLSRSEDELSAGDKLPVPTIDEVANYVWDEVTAQVAAPAAKVPPFSLSDLKGLVEFTQIPTWEPGRKIHILRPGLPAEVWKFLGIVGLLFGAIVGGFLFAPMLSYPGWLTCGVSALIGGVVALILGAWTFREREVILDWSNGELWWREARWERKLPFEEITACVLRGTTVKRTRNKSTTTEYRTDVLLETIYRTVWVIGTDGSSSDPDKSYQALVSFAANLAESLHIPWRWDEYTS